MQKSYAWKIWGCVLVCLLLTANILSQSTSEENGDFKFQQLNQSVEPYCVWYNGIWHNVLPLITDLFSPRSLIFHTSKLTIYFIFDFGFGSTIGFYILSEHFNYTGAGFIHEANDATHLAIDNIKGTKYVAIKGKGIYSFEIPRKRNFTKLPLYLPQEVTSLYFGFGSLYYTLEGEPKVFYYDFDKKVSYITPHLTGFFVKQLIILSVSDKNVRSILILTQEGKLAVVQSTKVKYFKELQNIEHIFESAIGEKYAASDSKVYKLDFLGYNASVIYKGLTTSMAIDRYEEPIYTTKDAVVRLYKWTGNHCLPYPKSLET